MTDTSAPSVTSVTPADSSTGVAVNSAITLNFSEVVSAVSVNSNVVRVSLQASFTPVPGTLATNGAVVTFTPSGSLPGNTQIGITVNGVRDYAGNTNSFFSASFTTAVVTDLTPPTVTSVTPPNGTANLGLNTQAVVAFSEAIDPLTATEENFGLFSGFTRLATQVSVSSDRRSVTLSAGILPANSTIQVAVSSGVRDLSGNPLADFLSSFSTVPFADATRPSVNVQRPANGATGVPLTSKITLFLSKPMDSASTTAAMKVSQNGALVAGSAVLSGNGQTLTFTPAGAFSNGALIEVFLASTAIDTFGNAANPYAGSFTTLAFDPAAKPLVTATIPGQVGSVPLRPVIEIQYSKPLDLSTVNGTNAGLFTTIGNVQVGATVTLRGTQTIRLVPNADLTASTSYYYRVQTALKDTNGLSPLNVYTQTFTTGTTRDTSQPRVLTVSPPDTSTTVGVNAPISLHFDEPLNTLTVSVGSGAAIQLTANGNPVAPASISFTSAQDVRITPYQTFPDNTLVTINVTAQVEDPSGNGLLPFSASFTTGAGANFEPPSVLSSSPADGSTGIGLNGHLELFTDTPMDPATVNVNSLTLYDNTSGGGPIAGTWAVSPNGRVVTFAPTANLPASHSLRLLLEFGNARYQWQFSGRR